MAADGEQAGAAPPRARPFDSRLLRELPALRASLIGSVLLGLLSSAGVVAQAVFLARLLAGAMPGARPGDRLVDFVGLAVAIAGRGVAMFLGEIVARLGAASAKAELRERLLGASLSVATHWQTTPGRIATLAGRGLDSLDVYFGRCLPDLVLAVLAPFGLALAVGIIDWPSALVIAVVLGLFPLFGALVGRTSARLAAERWQQVELLGHQVTDVFLGLPLLRALGRGALQAERIAKVNEALEKASTRTLRVAFLSALVLDSLASVSVALVAVPLGLRLISGSLHLAAALAVLIVVPEVFLPLRRASAEFHESTEGLAAAVEALAVIDGGIPAAPKEPAAGGASKRALPNPTKASIVLWRVRLDRPERRDGLFDDATLRIEPGETVVLTGANGSGKSTTAALLLGFLSPTSGAVRVGGVELSELDPRRWRQQIAYLPEHPHLLGATLAENLRLANEAASDDELLGALRRADGSRLIEALPDGLLTRFGEGGRAASAGERQRIALARVLLRAASLYILDEPTVHLDKEGEEHVVEELGRTLEGKSALIISHQPALLEIADRAVALSSGEFVPVGQTADPLAKAPAQLPAVAAARLVKEMTA